MRLVVQALPCPLQPDCRLICFFQKRLGSVHHFISEEGARFFLCLAYRNARLQPGHDHHPKRRGIVVPVVVSPPL